MLVNFFSIKQKFFKLSLMIVCISVYPKSLLSQNQTRTKRTDFSFALLHYEGGNWNPRPHGLPRLAWEIKKRTSIEINLKVESVEATDKKIFQYPMLIWQGEGAMNPFSKEAIIELRHYLKMGGSIVIDISSGTLNDGFYTSVKREIKRIFPEKRFKRISPKHVLYESFYLLDRHGGRVSTRAFLEGIFIEKRLAIILSSNDLAGAIARDEFGQWEYDVGIGNDRTREMTFRLGINMVMYILCLDYKKDQVHIPFILKRRQ